MKLEQELGLRMGGRGNLRPFVFQRDVRAVNDVLWSKHASCLRSSTGYRVRAKRDEMDLLTFETTCSGLMKFSSRSTVASSRLVIGFFKGQNSSKSTQTMKIQHIQSFKLVYRFVTASVC